MAETKSDVTLIGAWQSPFVLRAQIALNVKNLQYVFHEEKFGTKSELFLKSNPVHKKVPVLIHGDKPIWELVGLDQGYREIKWAQSDSSRKDNPVGLLGLKVQSKPPLSPKLERGLRGCHGNRTRVDEGEKLAKAPTLVNPSTPVAVEFGLFYAMKKIYLD
ncbi:hypothetical protein TIFTF001_049396 [Ficus carica]|uniref:Glutathione S-transferase n=1 Tax=Ficus carica TaxID=3494 RepID=A0AA87Z845_FICCA|nr:hypothetical protein TIFTF001_049393 [Ficus carica]GMN27773.1 hypothetical protein TIFTF001_049396 [Ficus carica]